MTRTAIKLKPHRNRFLRKRTFERDAGICASCSKYDAKFEADHIIPLWEGGSDALENMQTLCRGCHIRKSVGEAPIRAKTDRLRARHELTKKRRQTIALDERRG